MISMLSSMTSPLGSTSTGTVALGEASTSSAGLAESLTSRNSQVVPLANKASLARIA